MSVGIETEGRGPAQRASRSWSRRAAVLVIALLIVYLVTAYVLLPIYWRRYVKRHPGLVDIPRVTHTKLGLPGDPLNVALIGSEDDVQRAFRAAHWDPADPVTLKSSLRIAVGTVFHRPYDDAPVSPLFLFGRQQDLAFEQPVGNDPRKRHHVRFWRSEKVDEQGRPAWIGAATFDTRVGLSHETEEITHHIGPDIDADRDKVLSDIQAAGYLASRSWIDNFHIAHDGKNGGGDPYHTDGRLGVGVIAVPAADPTAAQPAR